MSADKRQLDKVTGAAREPECDDDEQRFKERIAKLVKHVRDRGVPEKKS